MRKLINAILVGVFLISGLAMASDVPVFNKREAIQTAFYKCPSEVVIVAFYGLLENENGEQAARYTTWYKPYTDQPFLVVEFSDVDGTKSNMWLFGRNIPIRSISFDELCKLAKHMEI